MRDFSCRLFQNTFLCFRGSPGPRPMGPPGSQGPRPGYGPPSSSQQVRQQNKTANNTLPYCEGNFQIESSKVHFTIAVIQNTAENIAISKGVYLTLYGP